MQHLSNEQAMTEMVPLLEALLDLSGSFVIKRGNFLPHGGLISDTGEVSLVGAAPENDMTNSIEVLPMVHTGLRAAAAKGTTRAIAVSESVFIGAEQTTAIKVLLEHRSGFTVAFYQTWKKRLLRAPVLGELQSIGVDPEIGGWAAPTHVMNT